MRAVAEFVHRRWWAGDAVMGRQLIDQELAIAGVEEPTYREVFAVCRLVRELNATMPPD